MTLIETKNLNFSYPTKKDTLKNINLKIQDGTFNCIVGENGSGKTTLIKCILGLNKGYDGSIKKEDHIGYLPQKSEIQANFPATIEEVVLSGTIGNSIRKIFYSKNDRKVARDIMERLGIYDIRKKCFADLSGGQQQRVLIARSLCATKDIIILDEPTNGLDPSIAIQIYELLDDAKHDMEEMLDAEVVEEETGELEVKGVFRTDKTEIIAGGQVTKGRVAPGMLCRFYRKDQQLGEGEVVNVQEGKVDVPSLAESEIGGLSFKTTKKIQLELGDRIEFFVREYKKKKIL